MLDGRHSEGIAALYSSYVGDMCITKPGMPLIETIHSAGRVSYFNMH